MILTVLFATLCLDRFKPIFCETSQFNATEATISTYNTSGLYGYEVSLQKINGVASLMVGVPPSSPQSGHGNLRKCQISVSTVMNTTMRLQCSSLPRTTGLPSDNIGQSFSTNARTGRALACSTTSVQKCTNMLTLPGYCYLFDTDAVTSRWKYLDHVSTRGCPKTNTVDVLFVLDGSGSVVSANFDKIKMWAVKVTDKLKVDEGVAKVAVMQFGSKVEMEFNFNDYSKLETLQRAIQNIEYDDGWSTYTVSALNRAGEVFKNSDRFSSTKNSQVMIILTDGLSTQSGVLAAAKSLRNMEVATYAVGVGSGINKDELRKLATGTNSNDRVYEVTNFDNLDTIVDSLQQQIETFIPNEGAGDLTVEMAQAGIGLTVSKNQTV